MSIITELCRKLEGCFHTGVREDCVDWEVGGTVIPTIPQAFQGVGVYFEHKAKETVTEISIYPIRTKEEGVMNFDLKQIVGLFDPLVCAFGRCQDQEKAILDFMGHYQGELFRVKLFLNENIKEISDANV